LILLIFKIFVRQDHLIDKIVLMTLIPYEKQQFQLQLQQHYEQSMWLYQQMIQAGVAKECARDVCPCLLLLLFICTVILGLG
jgi:thymidylate synthase ThyX